MTGSRILARSRAESETVAAGLAFAERLSAGDVVLVSGPLGAGKTAFVRGLAAGLGAEEDDVSSPTFTLVQTYNGRMRIVHADLYRLKADDVPDLALDELAEGAVLVVEWPDRWHAAPGDAWRVAITDDGGDARTLTVAD